MIFDNRAIVLYDKNAPDTSVLRLACMWARWVVQREAEPDDRQVDVDDVRALRGGPPAEPMVVGARLLSWGPSQRIDPVAAASVKRAHAAPGPRGVWGRRGPIKERRAVPLMWIVGTGVADALQEQSFLQEF